MALIEKLNAIAEAIRAKTGKTDKLTLDQMSAEIENIQADNAWEDLLITRAYTEYTNNRVTNVASSAFRNHSTVTRYSLTAAKTMGAYAFMSCTSLVDIDLPVMTNVSNRAFDGCTKLAFVHFPSVTSVDHASLSAMTALTTAIFDKLKSINTSTFSGCTKLKTLVLKNKTLVSLANVSAFNNSPGASGGTGCTVYVPQSLIESYQTATNWSALFQAGSITFAAIEGSEYE